MPEFSFLLNRLKNASVGELLFRGTQFLAAERVKQWPGSAPAVRKDDLEELHMPDLVAVRKPVKIAHGPDSRNDDQLPIVTDVRELWEPARLQYLTEQFTLATANGETNGTGSCVKQATQWLRSNPFPQGPFYKSSMECGLRILPFLCSLKSLRIRTGSDYQAICDGLYRHALWISKNMSLYSSLGNHTIAEATGLILAGGVFRYTSEGKRWLKTGVMLLEQELNHQVLDDGGPAEQSFTYLRFVLDLYWLSIGYLEKNNLYQCGHLKPRLILGEEFLKAFEDDGTGRFPSIGDGDDGYAVAPGLAPRRAGVEVTSSFYRCFSSSGYSIVSSPCGWKLIFDHGPLGMAPLHNHGHADALSIIVTKDGEELLVDPGTFRYNGAPEWRKYFRGTRAHNTVTVDGLDQAVQETSFIWSHAYNSRLVRSSDKGGEFLLEAQHDGYRRLKEPVKHVRTIRVAEQATIVVEDRFEGSGDHTYELNYHFHPDAVVRNRDGWWHLEKGKARAYFRVTGGDVTVTKGSITPIKGWYSPAYGVKQESPVLSALAEGAPGRVKFTSFICFEEEQTKRWGEG